MGPSRQRLQLPNPGDGLHQGPSAGGIGRPALAGWPAPAGSDLVVAAGHAAFGRAGKAAVSPPRTQHAAVSTDALAASLLRAPDLLRDALPGGGTAISRLRNQAATPNSDGCERVPLKGERFGSFMADVLKDATALAGKAGPGVSPARAAEAMRSAVIEGQLGADLGPVDKARMVYALYGVRQAAEALDALAPLLAATPGFQSLPPEQTWRMLLDRSAWDDGRHAGLRFENEPGYMGGMYNGLNHVLKAHQQGHQFDASMLEDVHDAATRGVYQQRVASTLLGEYDLQCAARRTGPEGAAGAGLAEKNCRFEPGFRDFGAVTFGLDAGDNVTRAGLKEYFVNQALHPGMQRCSMAAVHEQGERTTLRSASEWDGKSHLVLHAPALSRSQHIGKAGAIIARYRKQLPRATTEDAKLANIASCVQQLEQAHLFMDGNARTTGFLVLNKLLLENGLSPAMIADPNRFDGYSTKDLVQDIRQGQQTFAAHCRT